MATDPTKLTRVPAAMMDDIPVGEATVDTVGGAKLGSLETLLAGDDEGRVVPQSLARQLLGHELEWKRLPYQNFSFPNTALLSFGNGLMTMTWYTSNTTQMFVADNRGETIVPRTAVTALAHQAANYSPRWGTHVFMSNSTSFRWTYDGYTWTIGTTSNAPTGMGFAATCVNRKGQAMFFSPNYFYVHSSATTLTSTAWSTTWTGSTAAAHNDATGTTVVLGYTTNAVMRAVDDTTLFTRTHTMPFAMTQANSHKLTCGNGIFVGIVTGSNCVFRSTDDGVTWTIKGLPDGLFAQDIAFGDGKFVIATPANCPYVYVSTDGEDWTTVPLPTLTYSDVVPRIAFSDGDFYLWRHSQLLGRSGITSWFLRRRASTIPSIGDPIVPSTWSSFSVTPYGVVVPEGFNVLHFPQLGIYPIKSNLNVLVAAGTPAGFVDVQPGDFIYTDVTVTGCSFTYEPLPIVTLKWGATEMATNTEVDLQPYIDAGYTCCEYVVTNETLPAAGLASLRSLDRDQDIFSTSVPEELEEGSLSLASVGSRVRGTWSNNKGITLHLSTKPVRDWDGVTNSRRTHFSLLPVVVNKDITWRTEIFSDTTTAMLGTFWYLSVKATACGDPMSGEVGYAYVNVGGRAYEIITNVQEGCVTQSIAVPILAGLGVYGNADSIQIDTKQTPRIYVENAVEVGLLGTYVIPEGMSVMHLRFRFYSNNNTYNTIYVRKNGATLAALSVQNAGVEYYTVGVVPGDVITTEKQNPAYAFVDALLAGPGI